MIDYDKLIELFGDELPTSPSDFYCVTANPVIPSDLKIYNTANRILAYNIFKQQYKEFVSKKKVPSVAEKLAALKTKKREIVTK